MLLAQFLQPTIVFILQVKLLIFDLVVEQVLREQSDLLVDITRLLKQLVVHLRDPLHLDLLLLGESVLDGLHLTVVEGLLIKTVMLNSLIDAVLLALRVLLIVTILVVLKVLN